MKILAITAIAMVTVLQAAVIAAPPSKYPQPPARDRTVKETPPVRCTRCEFLQTEGATGRVMVNGQVCDPTKTCQIVLKPVTRGNGKVRSMVRACVCV